MDLSSPGLVGGARDAFGKRLKMCVWVPSRACLRRGAVCVGEECVFVFAKDEGVCVCVCAYLCLQSVRAAGKGGRAVTQRSG